MPLLNPHRHGVHPVPHGTIYPDPTLIRDILLFGRRVLPLGQVKEAPRIGDILTVGESLVVIPSGEDTDDLLYISTEDTIFGFKQDRASKKRIEGYVPAKAAPLWACRLYLRVTSVFNYHRCGVPHSEIGFSIIILSQTPTGDFIWKEEESQ